MTPNDYITAVLRLRIYRYAGSVVIDYRILRNYQKTMMRAEA